MNKTMLLKDTKQGSLTLRKSNIMFIFGDDSICPNVHKFHNNLKIQYYATKPWWNFGKALQNSWAWAKIVKVIPTPAKKKE